MIINRNTKYTVGGALKVYVGAGEPEMDLKGQEVIIKEVDTMTSFYEAITEEVRTPFLILKKVFDEMLEVGKIIPVE